MFKDHVLKYLKKRYILEQILQNMTRTSTDNNNNNMEYVLTCSHKLVTGQT